MHVCDIYCLFERETDREREREREGEKEMEGGTLKNRIESKKRKRTVTIHSLTYSVIIFLHHSKTAVSNTWPPGGSNAAREHLKIMEFLKNV